ncbi:hypothetical protein M514_03613, partial [Trichuris suis]
QYVCLQLGSGRHRRTVFIIVELAKKGPDRPIVSVTAKQSAYELCILGRAYTAVHHDNSLSFCRTLGLNWFHFLVFSMPQMKKRSAGKFTKISTKPEHRRKRRKTMGSEFSDRAPALSGSSEIRGSVKPLARDLKLYLADLAANIDPDMDEEQITAMTRNVLAECTGQELSVTCDREAGNHLQRILSGSQQSRLDFLSRIVYRKGSELVELFQTASGSRCFEELLTSTMSSRMESLAQQRNVLLKCAILLLENMDYLWSNLNSVHTLRCVGRVLVGAGTEDLQKPTVSKHMTKSCLPGIGYLDDDELRAVFNSLLEKVLDWKHKDYLNEEAFSLLSQDYLRFDALHEGKFTAQLSSEVLKETTEVIHSQWCGKQSSRFWEQLIRLSPNNFPSELYLKHLQTHLLKLSLHRFANFPLQRFLDRCSNTETASLSVMELINGFKDVWNSKNFGVIVSLMNTAKGTEALEQKLFKELQQVLGYKEESSGDLLPLVLSLGKHGSSSVEMEPQYFGSVLAQCLLQYVDKGELTHSTLQQPVDRIVKLSSHQYGSRYMEAFLRSLNTDERKAFIEKLQPYVFQLANDKFGSRVLEAALDRSDTDGKALLLRNLVCHEKELLRTPHGKVLALKYFLATLSQDEFRWAKQMQKSENRQLKYKELLSLTK